MLQNVMLPGKWFSNYGPDLFLIGSHKIHLQIWMNVEVKIVAVGMRTVSIQWEVSIVPVKMDIKEMEHFATVRIMSHTNEIVSITCFH